MGLDRGHNNFEVIDGLMLAKPDPSSMIAGLKSLIPFLQVPPGKKVDDFSYETLTMFYRYIVYEYKDLLNSECVRGMMIRSFLKKLKAIRRRKLFRVIENKE